jgi:hypothetical protein
VGHLLATARRAAEAGAVEVGAAVGLRHTLERLQDRLVKARAWSPEAPPWWGPPPPLSPLESQWLELQGDLKEAGEIAAEAAATCRQEDQEAPWQARSHWLPRPWTERLHGSLEPAFQEGRLSLEPGAVGHGRISVRRSDWVRYLRGTEPELLDLCPALALLIQWGLRDLPARLVRLAGPRMAGAGARPLFPPQRAMLTRYPAPSGGYGAHLDNPGGEADNGRSLTLVLYLNPPDVLCRGGELALWRPGRALSQPPDQVFPPGPGTAAFFDPRRVPHQVLPLAPGPARWALTFWFSAQPQEPPLLAPALPTLTDLLLPVAEPPLPEDQALLHRLEGAAPKGRIEVVPIRSAGSQIQRQRQKPRLGLVTTVHRAGDRLEAWCRHHLELGVDHLLVIQDRGQQPLQKEKAEQLRQRCSPRQLTLWNGEALADRGWPGLPLDEATEELRRLGRQGDASWAHAARQTLNATTALAAARRGELGGEPWEWILHLDADELFVLEGRSRGGCTLEEHLAVLEAAGLDRIRYLNHELLLPLGDGGPRFKLSPRLATARLGTAGWRSLQDHLALRPEDSRPYFRAYTNGKSAVRVSRARAAGGVHGWLLNGEAAPERDACLAGPAILHCHLPTAEDFRRTYRTKAQAPAPPTQLPFDLSPLEVAAVELVRARGPEEAPQLTSQLDEKLGELYEQRAEFPPETAAWLEEAGLLLRPRLGDFTAPLWRPSS